MSSKSSKPVGCDAKSRTKALLLMLEKLMSGGNSDKEQTRFLCHKLLHLVNNHDASKKEVSSKTSLEIILMILETCGDQITSITLVNTLSEIASGSGVKRLVAHDVTRVLLHTVAYLGKDGDSRLQIALLNLSVKIAPKDRRFALRVRLAGALPVLISIVRSHSSSSKLISSTLQCLKICSSNNVNAGILGRLGAIHVLQRLTSNLGRKNPALMKTALSTLSILVKSSRSNVTHAIGSGLLPHILFLYQEWHRNDAKQHRHVLARKSMLNIMKHLTASRRGRKALSDADGLRILHRSLKECTELPCAKAAEPLLSVGTLIVRRCQPRFRLPIPTVQCSFKFELPKSELTNKGDNLESSASYVDDVIDESDDDDDSEDTSDPVDNQDSDVTDAANKEKEATPAPIFIPPLGGTIPLKRDPDDLSSMYENFFQELIEFQLSEEAASENQEEKKDGSSNARGDNLEPVVNGHQRTISGGKHGILSRAHSESTMKMPPLKDQRLTAVPSLSVLQGTFSRSSSSPAFTGLENSQSEKCEAHRLSERHAAMMEMLMSSTISKKQAMNIVSYADSIGHIPPPNLEHQVVKKYGVQRIKMLDDVARTLENGDLVNKIVYSRDGNYRPPSSSDYQSYHVSLQRTSGTTPSNSDLNLKIDHRNVHAAVQNAEMKTPVIKESCFLMEPTPCQTQNKLPPLSCGCRETPISIPIMEEESANSKSPLRFRSEFESGNLRTAIQIRDYEYDLILDADCNNNHHHQWFYIEVSNVVARVPYRFNIVNCEKSNSQFNFGMQPVMYSVTEARLGQPSWKRAGFNLSYYKSHFSRSAVSAGGVKGRSYYTFTFNVLFHHNKDTCYFAYHYPYTYTQVQADIQELLSQVDEDEIYVQNQTLCHTLSGNAVPVLTITSRPKLLPGEDNQDVITEFRSRPYVFLSARVHPGESNASWTMRGTLKLLLSSKNSEFLSNKMKGIAENLRNSYIFKVVPMLNPDGVINGHHRSSLTGEDLNRQWTDPDPMLFPSIFHTKGLLQYLYSIGKAPLVYCDYHGHSRRKNVFVYGCSRRESVLAGETEAIYGAPDDYGFKGLPKVLHQLAPAFSLSNCSFVVEKCKESTARVVVWKELGVARSYTMESTYCGCDQGKYKGLQIGTRELEEMGMKFCEGLLHLKAKERARRLPLYDLPLADNDNRSDATSDIPSGDFGSMDNFDWSRRLSKSDACAEDIRCPTNSDEELTPEDVGSVNSFEGRNGNHTDGEPFFSEEDLVRRYSREFWDYNEFCRGFGFGSDDDEDDVRSAEMTSSNHAEDLLPQPAHFSISDDHVMKSSYRICPNTGRVVFDESPTNQLSDMIAKSSLSDSD